MKNILAIVGGASLGALLRYQISAWVVRKFVVSSFWGTFTVNMLGSFFIGVLWKLTTLTHFSPSIKLMIFTGFLGAFTTFSTFSLETFHLIEEGKVRVAFFYVLGSNFLGVSLAALGVYSTQLLHQVFEKA